MKKALSALLLSFVIAAPAMAETTFVLPTGTTAQDDFKKFSTDLGLAISYTPLSPAAPLGDLLPGFDAGVAVTAVKIDKNASYWKNSITPSSDLPDYLLIPKVHIQVGLPVIPIDIGYMYASVPTTDIKLQGVELKYAILKGGVAMPAVAIRGAYTKLSGINVFEMETKSLDLSISKGFLIFTPYAGVGQVWITSTPIGPTATLLNLKKEEISETKGFVGAKLTFFPFLNLVAEAGFAKVNLYSLRLNLHF